MNLALPPTKTADLVDVKSIAAADKEPRVLHHLMRSPPFKSVGTLNAKENSFNDTKCRRCLLSLEYYYCFSVMKSLVPSVIT
jgi:hypothetical protein